MNGTEQGQSTTESRKQHPMLQQWRGGSLRNGLQETKTAKTTTVTDNADQSSILSDSEDCSYSNHDQISD